MVLRHDQVEAALIGAVIDRVRRDRPGDVDPLGPRRRDPGGDLLVVLGPEEAVLAAVRVDPRHGDPRRGDPHPLQVPCPVRIVSSTRSGVARVMAVLSETCVETWITFSRSEASSIQDDRLPVSCASSPVWPS